MPQSTKARKSALEKIEAGKVYTAAEAVKLMQETKAVKFDATAEVHFRLGIDPRHADQQIRTQVSLPHGTGKKVKVAVFCGDEKVEEALNGGAVKAGGVELIEEVAKGWMDFDVAVATPDMMKNLAKVARVLGPKGLMPNPKAGTVTPDIKKAVAEIAAGKFEIRNDKNGIIHTIFGKSSFSEDQLTENLEAMIKAIQDAKPAGQKGTYFKNISVNSTMGVGIKVELPA